MIIHLVNIILQNMSKSKFIIFICNYTHKGPNAQVFHFFWIYSSIVLKMWSKFLRDHSYKGVDYHKLLVDLSCNAYMCILNDFWIKIEQTMTHVLKFHLFSVKV
jgi:hypothetical protein